MEKDDVGAWMVIDNAFYTPSDPDPALTYYWPGILFQLGSFKSFRYEFDNVELQSGGSTVARYGPEATPFAWINVVSDYPMTSGTHAADPLEDPNRAFYLYPNDRVWNCCDDLLVQVQEEYKETCGDLSEETLQACLRNRLLMWSMQSVAGILTYWQGPEGYSIQASQGGDPESQNRYELFTEDTFRVEVYEDVDGEMTMIAEYPSADHPETIDLVVVNSKATGPTDGAKQAPPWPDGEYP